MIQYLFCLMLLYSGCKPATNKNATEDGYDMFIYRIKYGKQMYESVTGIALVKGKVYYLANDSLLMTYKNLPAKAKEIQNNGLKNLMNNIDLMKLSTIKDYSRCSCKGITKTEYIIRLLKNNKEQNFVFNEVLNCEKNSPCFFLEELRNHFMGFKK